MEIRTLNDGSLIRIERLRKKIGQKELSYDICTVSYLSRIENEEIVPHKDLMKRLMSALGFKTLTEEKESYYKTKLATYFESFLSKPNFSDKIDLTSEELNELSSTALFPYERLANKINTNSRDSYLDEIHTLLPDEIQAIYYIVKARYHNEDWNIKNALDWSKKAVKLSPTGMAYLSLAESEFEAGFPEEMISNLAKAEELLLKEGSLAPLVQVALYRAMRESYYPNEHTIKLYDIALKMAETINDEKLISQISYNGGASALEIGQYDKARFFLDKCKSGTPNLFYHKRALLEILTDNYKKAEEYLELFKNSSAEKEQKRIFTSLLSLRLKYKNNYLIEDETLNYLEELYAYSKAHIHFGFLVTYGRELIECLKQHRQYKRALEIEEELFINNPFKHS